MRALAFFLPLALYLETCMREPGIYFDYIKMATVGKVWGIPHPPGFPLYLVINGLVSSIPAGTITFRVAGISAVSMALASHLIYRTSRLLGFARPVALGTALLSATSYALWLQGIITDVYAVGILLLLATLWALFRWAETDNDRWLWFASWLFILSLANHPSTLVALPGFLVFALASRPRAFLRAAMWLHVAGAVLVVVALYGYIHLRSFAQPLYNECMLDGDLARFWDFVTAEGFRTQVGAKPDYLSSMWSVFVGMGIDALGKPGWFAAWVGIVPAAIRNRNRAFPLILVPAGVLIATSYFHAKEIESRLSPIYPFATLLAVSLAVWVVETVSALLRSRSRRGEVASRIVERLGIAAILVALALGIANHLAVNLNCLDYSGPSEGHASAVRIVRAVERPCLILTNYDEDLALQLLYCICTNPDPEINRFPFVSSQNQELARLAVMALWNQEIAMRALSEGYHLYTAGENHRFPEDEQFDIVAVDTGTEPAELFELIPRQR